MSKLMPNIEYQHIANESLFVCGLCGASVFNLRVHDAWHLSIWQLNERVLGENS